MFGSVVSPLCAECCKADERSTAVHDVSSECRG